MAHTLHQLLHNFRKYCFGEDSFRGYSLDFKALALLWPSVYPHIQKKRRCGCVRFGMPLWTKQSPTQPGILLRRRHTYGIYFIPAQITCRTGIMLLKCIRNLIPFFLQYHEKIITWFSIGIYWLESPLNVTAQTLKVFLDVFRVSFAIPTLFSQGTSCKRNL